MRGITHHGFLAASHGSATHRDPNAVLLLLRRVAVAWRADHERRIMAQVEPRLLADAGLERFGERD